MCIYLIQTSLLLVFSPPTFRLISAMTAKQKLKENQNKPTYERNQSAFRLKRSLFLKNETAVAN